MTSIDIPESVREIGEAAFIWCRALEEVVLPPRVTEIADHLFNGCAALTSVTMLGKITRIGSFAFSGCDSLTLFAVPESVQEIGTAAFMNCCVLQSVTVPEATRRLGSGAFQGCTGLVSAVLRNRPEYFEDFFRDCSSLVSVNIPDSATTIGRDAFLDCTSLTSIDIPQGVTTIGPAAFSGCAALTSVVIPDSVIEIGGGVLGGAFEGCTGLISLRVPESVTQVAENAFEGCTSLASSGSGVLVVDGVAYLPLEAGGVQVGDGLTGAGEEGSALRSVTIPSSVELHGETLRVVSVGRYAFMDCTRLESVTIPETVAEIGDHAFRGCVRLKSVSIPASVVSIGMGAFAGCERLDAIEIPDSVTVIGSDAFEDCDLKSVHVPASIQSIGEGAFQGCPLGSVVLPEGSVELGGRCFRDAFELVISVNTLRNDRRIPYLVIEGEGYFRWGWPKRGTMVTTVADADSEERLFTIWMGLDGESGIYYRSMKACWSPDSTDDSTPFFDFRMADRAFDRLKSAVNRGNFALARLAFPTELSNEAREKYEGYINRGATRALKRLVEGDYAEILRRVEHYGWVNKKNVDALISHARVMGSSRTIDYLMGLRLLIAAEAAPASDAVAGESSS